MLFSVEHLKPLLGLALLNWNLYLIKKLLKILMCLSLSFNSSFTPLGGGREIEDTKAVLWPLTQNLNSEDSLYDNLSGNIQGI